jgi:uncharacterized membrane protein YphA (DoxX/SURF4 family)
MTYSRSNVLRIAGIALRVALGGIFAYAAYLKLKDPWALFAMNIESYKVLPLWAVELVARTLPWAEMLLGVLLIVGFFRRTATTAASLLLLVFFSMVVRAYAKGMEINCGCFGPGEAISWKTMLRDGSMLAGAVLVTVMSYLERRKPAPPAAAEAPAPQPAADRA